MRYVTALVVGLAAVSSAFLIPPEIPDDIVKDTRFQKEHKNDKDLIHALLAEKTEVLNLECPGCPYAAAHREDRDAGPENQGITWMHDVENSIHLEFDTHEHGFQINGHPIFPFEAAQRARSTLVKAHQIRKDTYEHSLNFPLNFAVDVSSPVVSPNNDGIELVHIDFTILGLNGVPVKVSTISIDLIKTSEDEYVISQIKTIPFSKTPGAKTCENSASWSLCRVKAIVAARIQAMLEAAKERSSKMQSWVMQKASGCMGMTMGKGKAPHGSGPSPHKHHHEDEHEHDHHRKPHDHPHHDEEHKGEHHKHHDRPHHDEEHKKGDHHRKPHDRPHHDGEHKEHHNKSHKKPCPHHEKGHHKHHKLHRLAHMLHQMVRFFIIPAVLGIIGGLAASAIGMLVGQAIVFFWIKTYRNGRRGPVLREREEVVIVEGEKDELLGEVEDSEGLPEYSDAVPTPTSSEDGEEEPSFRDEKN